MTVETQWSSLLQAASTIPTFNIDLEPNQILSNIIPNLSGLLALRSAVGLRLAAALGDLSDNDQGGQQGLRVHGPS